MEVCPIARRARKLVVRAGTPALGRAHVALLARRRRCRICALRLPGLSTDEARGAGPVGAKAIRKNVARMRAEPHSWRCLAVPGSVERSRAWLAIRGAVRCSRRARSRVCDRRQSNWSRIVLEGVRWSPRYCSFGACGIEMRNRRGWTKRQLRREGRLRVFEPNRRVLCLFGADHRLKGGIYDRLCTSQASDDGGTHPERSHR